MLNELQTILNKHDEIAKKVSKLEQTRELDRSSETWLELKKLKKEKLAIKDRVEFILASIKTTIKQQKTPNNVLYKTVIFENNDETNKIKS